MDLSGAKASADLQTYHLSDNFGKRILDLNVEKASLEQKLE